MIPPTGGAPAADVSETIAAAVMAVPGVAGLHGGAFGLIASYLPGRSVTGVRIRADVTDVHVVLFWGAPVLATADRVRAAVQPLVLGISARVDVTVDDVVDPAPAVGIVPETGAPEGSGPAGQGFARPVSGVEAGTGADQPLSARGPGESAATQG